MKKILAMVLALVMCLSLGACGAESQEEVAGEYWPVSGFGEDDPASILLNDDYTYDWGYSKGTYKVGRDKIFLHYNNNSDNTTTLIKQGDVYYVESSFEPIKNEYGQTVTFSETGRIEHTFSWSDYSEDKTHHFEVALREDGTFTVEEHIQNLIYKDGELNDLTYESNESEGTYSLENGVLTFTSEDCTFYWVYNENGLSKKVYKKYTVEEIKEMLLGKWENEHQFDDIPSYEFLEDGTAVRHTLSGDITYTYEIVADGRVNFTGADNSDEIIISYTIEKCRMKLWLLDPEWGDYMLFMKD